MAKSNDTHKPTGTNQKRMNPSDFARNNLAKGGVNNLMGKSPSTTGTAKRK